jgi:hypothetical protein
VFSAVVRTNDGGVCISASAQVHVVVDVTGVWTGTSALVPSAAQRLFDSRSGSAIGSATRTITVTVPKGTTRVQLSVTIVTYGQAGALLLWNCADSKPTASVVFAPAGSRATATVTLNASGAKLCLASTSSVHVAVDLVAAG